MHTTMSVAGAIASTGPWLGALASAWLIALVAAGIAGIVSFCLERPETGRARG